MKLKKFTALALALALGLSMTACAPKTPAVTDSPSPTPVITPSVAPTPTPTAPAADRTAVNIAVLKGNTGMSAVKLMADNEAGATANDYHVTIAAAPDEITGKLINGDLDIAALPTNVAATLYNKTDGGVQMLALCGLGVLYVLENGDSVHSIADLKGKTLYATGQGANPEYVLNYLLTQNGLDPKTDLTVEWKSSDELTALMASGEIDLAMMPVPAATGVMMKNTDMRFALDFNKEWSAVASEGVLTMSCVVARTDFIKENPQAVEDFLTEYQASIQYVSTQVDEAAKLVAQYQITPNEKVAAAAIPQIALVYMAGAEMRDGIQGYYEVLWQADPKSIGGSIPDDAFFYGA